MVEVSSAICIQNHWLTGSEIKKKNSKKSQISQGVESDCDAAQLMSIQLVWKETSMSDLSMAFRLSVGFSKIKLVNRE